jgi:hypothetical protein
VCSSLHLPPFWFLLLAHPHPYGHVTRQLGNWPVDLPALYRVI